MAWEPGYDNLNNKQEIQQSAAALPLLFVLETSDCTGATGHIDPMSGRNLVKLSLNKLRTQLHQLTAVCKRGFSMQQKILSKGRMWSRSEHKEQRWRQTVFSSDGRVAAAATLCVWEADSRGSVGWIGLQLCVSTHSSADKQLIVGCVSSLTEGSLSRPISQVPWSTESLWCVQGQKPRGQIDNNGDTETLKASKSPKSPKSSVLTLNCTGFWCFWNMWLHWNYTVDFSGLVNQLVGWWKNRWYISVSQFIPEVIFK